MSLKSAAEITALVNPISNQGTGPTPSPEQNINRDPVEQGNTSAEKSLNKPLTGQEKEKLILDAIQKNVPFPVLTWGSTELFSLLSYGEENFVGTETGKSFFLQLLLFVAKPDIAKDFDEAVDDGLEIVGKLLRFFNDLDSIKHHQEFIDYSRIDIGTTDERYKNIAMRYLSGAELKMVLDLTEESKSATRTLSPSWYMTTEPEEPPFTLTDEELLVALDRYHPGVQWPADKKTVIADEKMRDHLTFEEKYRLRILNETPEQKEKRLVSNAVYKAINGPSIPEQIRSINDKVTAATGKAGAVSNPIKSVSF